MNTFIDGLRIYKRLLVRAWHSHQHHTHRNKAHHHATQANRSIT